MAHKRESIRKAIVTAVTGLTTTGSNVFSGITYDLASGDLPALKVYAKNEQYDEDNSELVDIEGRLLMVTVEAVEKASTDLDDTLDDICEEVEIAIAGSTGVADLVIGGRLDSTEIEFESGAELPVGTATMKWAIFYRVDSTAPSA